MIAVDTNLIVRLLTQDDAAQTKVANSIFAAEEIWIGKTVLLETYWVLDTVYGFAAWSIREAFQLLIGLPNVRLEDEGAVVRALSWLENGIDFADGLHLASRPSGVRFVSFDKKFVRRAQRAGVEDVGVR